MGETIKLLVLLLSITASQTNGLEVKCLEKLQKTIPLFPVIENARDPLPPSVHTINMSIPTNHCYIDVPINLPANDTLTIVHSPDREITSLTIATRSVLPELPVEIFNIFPNLTDVEMYFSGIALLDGDDFVNASNLLRLHLAGNTIRTLGRAAFTKLRNLTLLALPINQIMKIDDFTFADMPRLVQLNLAQNYLVSISEHAFSGLGHLRKLFLNDNQITTIADGALYLDSLEELSLQGNNLKELSADLLTATPALRIIDLSRNKLTAIGETFGRCPNVYYIDLSDNQFQTIDWLQLANIRSLRILSLQNNALKMDSTATATTDDADDDDYLRKLATAHKRTNLQYLNLAKNKLYRSDALNQLTALRNIRYVNLDNNPFIIIDGMKTIRENYPNLVAISVRNATLSCEWLEKIVPFIKKSKVTLVTDEIHAPTQGQRKEIDGMVCVPPKTE